MTDGQLPVWLAANGLGQYADAFRAHGLDQDDLPDLTDDELRELGLTIGERKQLRRSIAAGLPPAGETQVQAATLPERRPLTVMFVDLVDSSALTERLDAEDMIDVFVAYRDLCDTAIRRFGGQIARVVGDGILAFFCYPVAHENDPERGVRAALDIIRAIGALQTPTGAALRVRIGVATGSVVVSDLLAGGIDERRSVTGSTPNLAARLQSLAPPNGAMISEATHARVHALFACEPLGALALRGFPERQNAYQVLAAIPQPAPGFYQPPVRMTPLFGRDAQIAALGERWSAAEQGDGGVVVVGGEAGIGKSRLVESFLTARRGTDAQLIRLVASPFHGDSPLRPFADWLRAAAGLEDSDSAERRRVRLLGFLRGAEAERARALPVLARLLGIADVAAPDVAPAKLRELIRDALAAQLLVTADIAPLCLVVEDLHWLDPTSMELLEYLAGRLAGRRVLLVLTARDGPELDRAAAIPGAAALRLDRLRDEDLHRMIRAVFGGQHVPDFALPLVAYKTDGVPLFVEELLRPLRDAELPPDWSSASLQESGPVEIPASLHEALMARLDKSGSAKQLAQVAAVIGRSVRRDILAAAAGLPDDALAEALDALRQSGILQPDPREWEGRLTFTHALVRDAAYDSILRQRRRDLHARVGAALAQDAAGAGQQPEVVAHHLTEAGLPEQAVPLWLRAARRSLAESALLEASRLLQRGLTAAASLPETPANLQSRLEIIALLGPVLIALKGPGSVQARALYDEAYALCRDLPEQQSHFPIYWGWQRLSRDYHQQRQRVGTLLARAQERNDPDLLLQSHHGSWGASFTVGDLDACCRHIEAGMAIYDRGDYRHHAVLYGNHDPKVCAHANLSEAYWIQGRPLAAQAAERQGLDWAATLRHVGTWVHAMDVRLLHGSFRRDPAAVLALARELHDFTAEHGFADHQSKAAIFQGWATAALGDPQAGLELLQDGLAHQRLIGTPEDFPIYACLQAEALAAAGQPEAALEELRHAEAEFAQLGLGIWAPEVRRMRAAMLLLVGAEAAADEALAIFDAAAAQAAQQGAAMLGLRIATSAAALEHRIGRPREALTRLRAARRLVAEDDGGVDLRTADALARHLAAVTGMER